MARTIRCATVDSADQEGPRDLLGRKTAEQAQCERDARFGREHRMAGGEDEAQQVVADVIVDRCIEIGLGELLLDLDVTSELLLLSLEDLVTAHPVDAAMLRGGHEPGPRVVGDA